MRRFAPRLAALLAAVLTLALGALSAAGCGIGNDADDVLKDTFSGSKNVKSGNLEVDLSFTGKGGQSTSQGPVSIKLAGPFQSQGARELPKFDLDASFAAGGQQQSFGAISTGDKGFVKIAEDTFALPSKLFDQFTMGFEQAQSESAKDKDRTSLGALGIDPVKWLKDAKVEDEEKVGGVDTKHVTAGVDVGKLADDVNKVLAQARKGGGQARQLPSEGITDKDKKQLEEAIKEARFDVWSGKDDKVLRKLAIKLDFEVPKGQMGPGGVTSGTLDFTLTLTALNEAQKIAEPRNAKGFRELRKKVDSLLGGLAGGLGGAGGSGGSGGPSGSSKPDPRAKKYLNCLSRAAGDVEKAQECADLLNS